MTTRRLLAIASVERTGSTLLCSILRATKAAGNPVEYLNIQTNNFATFRERHHTPRIKASFLPMALARKATGRFPWRDISSFSRTSFIDYLHEIAEVNTTSNGVFGVKMHWNQYKRHMLDLGVDVSLWGAPVSWLRITRENELRQAISFVRAAQTESWNSNMAVTKEPRYDAAAIIAALDRIASENHDWDRYFAEHSITPLHITYEQLTREMDHTIRLVLGHVGAHVDVVPPPTTKSQSDALNAEWAERFVSEHPEHAHRRSIPRTN